MVSKVNFLAVVGAAVAIFAAVNAFAIAPRNNSLIIGNITLNDTLLFQQFFNVTGIPGISQLQFANYTGVRNITRIRALDQALNNTGGFASLVYGGVGQRSASVRLQSSAHGRGFQFLVDIYGR